jgi:hypothetical protein
MVNESWGLEVPLNDDREGAGVRSRGHAGSNTQEGTWGERKGGLERMGVILGVLRLRPARFMATIGFDPESLLPI